MKTGSFTDQELICDICGTKFIEAVAQANYKLSGGTTPQSGMWTMANGCKVPICSKECATTWTDRRWHD